MKLSLILTFCLAGFLPVVTRASEPTQAAPLVPQEESGVMAHGTIFNISHRQIVILTPASREPVRYSHGEGTVSVDASDNPVTLEIVKSGIAVTVFYSEVENQRMANRVVVGDSPRVRTSRASG